MVVVVVVDDESFLCTPEHFALAIELFLHAVIAG